MALAHMSVKVGKVGNASAHSDYIMREGYYTGYNKGEVMEYKEAGNMPSWASENPSKFWEAADIYERKNGNAYKEWEISLPRELTPEQRIRLAKDFIKNEIGEKYAYQFAIHNPKASDGGEQPHIHLMFSERRINPSYEPDQTQYFKRANKKFPERGGYKKDNTGMKLDEHKALLKALRERWEITCNQHLKMAKIEQRISMKSYQERGMKQKPQIHLGPLASRMEKREINRAKKLKIEYKPITKEGRHNEIIRERNKAWLTYDKLKNDVAIIIKESIQKVKETVNLIKPKIDMSFFNDFEKDIKQKQEEQKPKPKVMPTPENNIDMSFFEQLDKEQKIKQQEQVKEKQQQKPRQQSEWGNNKPQPRLKRRFRR